MSNTGSTPPFQTNNYPSHLPHPHNINSQMPQWKSDGPTGFLLSHPLTLLARQKETNPLPVVCSWIIDTMTLSVDGFLAKIGSMGRFQWVLVCVVGVMLVPVTFQTLIMTFLGLEPPWRCVRNSSVCNFTRKSPATSCYSFKGFVGICLVILSCSLKYLLWR